MKKLILSLTWLLAFSFSQAQPETTLKATVHFATASSKLDAAARHTLDSLAELAKPYYMTSISVVGHTDARGSLMYNQILSSSRASAVHSYLNERVYALPDGSMQVGGQGENQPVSDNKTAAGMGRNRRVDIVMTYSPANHHKKNMLDQATATVPVNMPKPFVDKRKQFRGQNGTLVFLDPADFEKDYLDSATIGVDEFFDDCRILSSGLSTTSTDGNCLETGGMVKVDISYKNVGYTPKGDEIIEIWVPAVNPDPEMYIYYDAGGKWKDSKVKPEIKTRDNRQYYVIKSTLQKGWNLDKPICPCPASGPFVKVPLAKYQQVYLQLNQGNYTKLVNTQGRRFRMPRTPEQEVKPVIKAYAVKDKQVYIAVKPLDKIRYHKWNQTYVLRKRDFTKMKMEGNDALKDILCSHLPH